MYQNNVDNVNIANPMNGRRLPRLKADNQQRIPPRRSARLARQETINYRASMTRTDKSRSRKRKNKTRNIRLYRRSTKTLRKPKSQEKRQSITPPGKGTPPRRSERIAAKEGNDVLMTKNPIIEDIKKSRQLARERLIKMEKVHDNNNITTQKPDIEYAHDTLRKFHGTNKHRNALKKFHEQKGTIAIDKKQYPYDILAITKARARLESSDTKKNNIPRRISEEKGKKTTSEERKQTRRNNQRRDIENNIVSDAEQKSQNSSNSSKRDKNNIVSDDEQHT
jgi:hypothetical protein